MGDVCEPAARFDDPIEHSHALSGLVTGMAIGLAAVAFGAAVLLSGGTALAVAPVVFAACTAASLGGTIGQLAGSLWVSEAGKITSGAESVIIGGEKAARAMVDTVGCHPGKLIAQGSETVFIERYPAARKGDKTVCDGTISEGFPDVIVGSGRASYLDIDSEVPVWLEIGVMILGLVGPIGEIVLVLRARAALMIALKTGTTTPLLLGQGTRRFVGDQAVRHFQKHSGSLMKALGKDSYNLAQYLDDANHVIRSGQWVPELNGYAKLVGGQGSAKAAFVGVDRASGAITTFHVKTVEELASKAPSLGWFK